MPMAVAARTAQVQFTENQNTNSTIPEQSWPKSSTHDIIAYKFYIILKHGRKSPGSLHLVYPFMKSGSGQLHFIYNIQIAPQHLNDIPTPCKLCYYYAKKGFQYPNSKSAGLETVPILIACIYLSFWARSSTWNFKTSISYLSWSVFYKYNTSE